MEAVIFPWLARACGIVLRSASCLLCGVFGLCTAACSSNLGSARHRKRFSSKYHRCFLFLINSVTLILGAIILESGVTGWQSMRCKHWATYWVLHCERVRFGSNRRWNRRYISLLSRGYWNKNHFEAIAEFLDSGHYLFKNLSSGQLIAFAGFMDHPLFVKHDNLFLWW